MSCNLKNINDVINKYIEDNEDLRNNTKLQAINETFTIATDNIHLKIKLMLLSKIVEKYGIKHINDNIKSCLTPSSLISTKGNCNLTLINLILSMRLDVLLLAFKNKEGFKDIVDNDLSTHKDKLNIEFISNYNNPDNFKFNKNDELNLNEIKFNSIENFILYSFVNINSKINLDKDDKTDHFEPLAKITESAVENKSKSYEKITPKERSPKIEITQNLIDSIIEILEKVSNDDINFDDMTEKIHIYSILYVLIQNFYSSNQEIIDAYHDLVIMDSNKCAPRSFIATNPVLGGYNNKSGDIDYHICKANFKQTFKKVSAKSSREAAKMVAMKVLKDKKKSVKFTLKRMIGKKEKCYDYDVSIDKSGKIIIKNQ
jgi:hypothetical protein